jgi:aryl-alcohol dehydrogenase-like predicted oxidoreductase
MRPLGRSGLDVSALAWGNWRLCGEDVAASADLLRAAIDAGINLVDTADIYGPRQWRIVRRVRSFAGRVLNQEPSLRTRIVLATKAGISMGVPYDSSYDYLTRAIEIPTAGSPPIISISGRSTGPTF